jgi:hypothetical protein
MFIAILTLRFAQQSYMIISWICGVSDKGGKYLCAKAGATTIPPTLGECQANYSDHGVHPKPLYASVTYGAGIVREYKSRYDIYATSPHQSGSSSDR